METKSLFSYPYMRALAAIVLLMLIVALGSYAKSAANSDRYDQWGPTTISVRGEAEILAKPDIGSFSFSVLADGEDAAAAQADSAERTNAILTYLDEQGVAEADIKTQNYNLNPKYRYEERVCPANMYCPPGEPIIDGYQVSQSITVKVRDLDMSGDLISGVGNLNATNISGLQFTIDDESALQAEARAEAIADAKAKAKELAKDLDVRLKGIRSFYEETSGQPMYYGGDMMARSEMSMNDSAPSPKMPTGENTINSVVNITYEVK